MKSLKERFDAARSQFQAQATLSDRNSYLILALVVLGVLAVRLSMIGTPSLEWTAWKEIDYLTISKNYWQHGFNFLKPEVTWPAEPPRVTEMELPLVPYFTAVLYQLFGYGALTARAIPLIAYLVMIIYIYKLGKRECARAGRLGFTWTHRVTWCNTAQRLWGSSLEKLASRSSSASATSSASRLPVR